MFAVRPFQSSCFKGLGKQQWAAPFVKHPIITFHQQQVGKNAMVKSIVPSVKYDKIYQEVIPKAVF